MAGYDDWMIVQQEGGSLAMTCERCGCDALYTLPMTVDGVATACVRFEAQHRECVVARPQAAARRRKR